jgi:hypothetical protein
MMELLLVVGGLVAAIVALALILPCEACRLRRERMKQAYATWRADKERLN